MLTMARIGLVTSNSIYYRRKRRKFFEWFVLLAGALAYMMVGGETSDWRWHWLSLLVVGVIPNLVFHGLGHIRFIKGPMKSFPWIALVLLWLFMGGLMTLNVYLWGVKINENPTVFVYAGFWWLTLISNFWLGKNMPEA